MHVVRVEMCSNYDCTNSGDTYATSDYLQAVHAAVRRGVPKAEMMREHMNGAYGASLLCFVLRVNDRMARALEAAVEGGGRVAIPKGTRFGFYSSFQGCGSPFAARTAVGMRIPSVYGPTKWDCVRVVHDGIPGAPYRWTMRDTYGLLDWV
jgi:hypothetical protein